MKRRLLSLAVLVILVFCMVPTALAEETTESEFDLILLKGSLIVKEYLDFKTIDHLTLQIATFTNPIDNTKYKALRLEGYASSLGILDADEVESVISTLEYIQQNLPSMKDYTEINYETDSGFRVTAYVDGKGCKIYLSSSSNSKNISTEYIEDFISALREAQAELVK